MADLGHWTSEAEVDPEEDFGFIYNITNKLTGQSYIGRKAFHKTVKGKKAGPSDWASYRGSSKYLNSDMEEFGVENFEFSILFTCPSLSWLKRAELEVHLRLNVVYAKDDLGNYLYYNRNVGDCQYVPQERYAEEMLEKIRINTE